MARLKKKKKKQKQLIFFLFSVLALDYLFHIYFLSSFSSIFFTNENKCYNHTQKKHYCHSHRKLILYDIYIKNKNGKYPLLGNIENLLLNLHKYFC